MLGLILLLQYEILKYLKQVALDFRCALDPTNYVAGLA